ncbi:Flavin-containing monooxygenase-like protein [Macrophomina phaseolina MS6]|uniref:Flavin-containing monooxygenase-like protein n=1 Tax=Macrophomina phaseolina (strain MS6) TaxID=1126212 RepID=K2RHT3_MACPH|nr:Flavin-containing monooxygenase-like protein [Macrophomina phaseolina MS6]
MATGTESSQAELPSVLKKYADERHKRVQARPQDGSKRTMPLSESKAFRNLEDDPWVDHDALNAQHPRPLVDGQQTNFLILGAGHGGLIFAASLVDAGFPPEDVRFVDSAGGFGGTWYWNRYPGLMCDIESSVYMPLLEETGYVPKNRYAYGPELREHAERIAKKWQLEDKALFRSVVKRLEWNEQEKEWTASITEYRGLTHGTSELRVRARFVILGGGVFGQPQVPKAPGFERFKPHYFHTARWDYKYTGGSPEDQRLENLKGKRVAIIGTGSTGIQVVPELAKWAKEVYVFQRTPASVDFRNQRSITPEAWNREVATGDGWQLKRMENFASHITNAANGQQDLVDDGWSHASAFGVQVGGDGWGVITPDKIEEHVKTVHALDLPRTERIRRRVNDIVKDQATAEKLKAWYPSWCKRPCFHDDYLAAFNKPNVHLIDTNGKGVEAFTETALVANGTEYPVDALVLATGYRSPFDGNASPAHRAKIEVLGRGGRNMDDKWDEGVATLHGFSTNDFPNLFFPGLAQAGLAPNITHTLTLLSRHVAHVLAQAKQKAGSSRFCIEPTRQAEEDWSMRVVEGAGFFAPAAGCTPGLVNDDGRKDGLPASQEEAVRTARNAVWPRGIISFGNILKDWREQGNLDGINVSA